MATTVKITETYDMKTTVNRLGLVGVHTPQVTQLKRLYPGLLKNHRFFRFIRCDVVGACASVLPADPLQIGVSEGTVAPEDMFNPILYKAVTNESFDTLIARVRGLTDVSALGSVANGYAVPAEWDTEGNFTMYYSLLGENREWRKAMPQQGFRITNLVPLAHTIVSTFGNVGPNMGNNYALSEDGETPVEVPDMNVVDLDSSYTADADGDHSIFFRGKTVRMPKFPCHTSAEAYDELPDISIPKTHVLAMVLPPARLHEFWYRMRVTWTIRFENVISALEVAKYGTNMAVGGVSYARNYTYSSSKSELENSSDAIESDGVEIHKVMES